MRKKFVFVIILLLAAVLLSGCTGSVAWPGLTASEEVAYLANTVAVQAVDLKNGTELWSFSGENTGWRLFNTNPSLFVTNPVITPNGLVIVVNSGNDHAMYAVDPKDIDPEENTPAIEWKFTEAKGHWIAPPLIVDDRLFAPNADGYIYVLDLGDGQSVKKAIKVIGPFQNSEDQPGRLWAQPVTDGERLFITSLDHSVFAVDLNTYEVIWREDLGGAVPGGAVLASDGMLYVGSLARQLERFDPATGAHESVLETNGWVWGTPVADGDNLYFGDVDGYFYSYNTVEGALNWEPVKPDSAITASPLVLGELVLVATESGNIYSVDDKGETALWHGVEDGNAYTTPVFAGDYILVAYLEADYHLVALDEEGDQKWVFPQK